MTETQSRTLDRIVVLFIRLLKWAGLVVLLFIFVLFLALYLYAHRGSRPWIETRFPPIAHWRSLKITLSRGPCLGTCPVYNVAIDGLGNVTFDGDVRSVPPPAYGMVHRTYRSKISEASVQELFAAFQKAKFFWLYNVYVTGATDLPEYKISIAFDGHRKEVVDYMGRAVGMPKEVSELEVMVDHIVGTRRWLTYDGTLPAAQNSEPPEPTLLTPKIPKAEPPKFTIEEPDGVH